jgi:hypothetical protein
MRGRLHHGRSIGPSTDGGPATRSERDLQAVKLGLPADIAAVAPPPPPGPIEPRVDALIRSKCPDERPWPQTNHDAFPRLRSGRSQMRD